MEQEYLIDEVHKQLMRRLVAQTEAFKSVYKYCSFEGGLAMLSSVNLQFTRADELNDDLELNLEKCNFTEIINLLDQFNISEETWTCALAERQSFFNGIGICSCGKTRNNETLWSKYASNEKTGEEDGLCIELNQSNVINYLHKHGIIVMSLLVNYVNNIYKTLPWKLFLGNKIEQTYFLQLLYTTKLKKLWGKEDEIRFIYSEPFSGKNFRPNISPNCIMSVTYGKDMTIEQRKKVGAILNRHRNIKRIFR